MQQQNALRILTRAEAVFRDPGRAVDTASQTMRAAVDSGTTSGRVTALVYSLRVLARYGHHELCARADGYV
jgi:hypothetical protein